MLTKKKKQRGIPGGHPSKYKPRPTGLNYELEGLELGKYEKNYGRAIVNLSPTTWQRPGKTHRE